MALPSVRDCLCRVKVLSVLANHNKIDIFRRLSFRGGPDALGGLTKPEVDILVEVEAHREGRLLQHPGRTLGSPIAPDRWPDSLKAL